MLFIKSPWRAAKFRWFGSVTSSPTIIRWGGTLKTHGEGPNGHREWVTLFGAQNELDFCSALGDLAPTTHVGSQQIGYRQIAREWSDGGCICFPFISTPPRSYDAAGGGGDSVELNWLGDYRRDRGIKNAPATCPPRLPLHCPCWLTIDCCV